jgi:tagatose 6-phosphate kinase
MTVVVCPNLAIDRVVRVDELVPGATMRGMSMQHQAGGKGANVARALAQLGGDALLVGYAAGETGLLIAELAAAESLEVLLVATAGEARVSTVFLEIGGRVTDVFEYGPRIAAADEAALLATVADLRAREGEWAVVDGSAPPGSTDDFFAKLVNTLHDAGYHVLLDATGAQLAPALAASPEVVKVNAREAGAGADERGVDERAVDAACARLIEAGAQIAVVTLGAAGAAACAHGRAFRVATNAVETVNPTGSGDCFAAGLVLCLEREDTFEAALAVASGAATANAASPLTAHFDTALAAKLTAEAVVTSKPVAGS